MNNYNDHRKEFHENRNIKLEQYYLNGQRHRTDGPAIIYYYENGNKESEHYYLNGQIHRTDGPAIIYYYGHGKIISKYYYLDNKPIYVNSTEEFRKYMKVQILK